MIHLSDAQRQALLQMRTPLPTGDLVPLEIFLELLDLRLIYNLGNGRFDFTPLGEQVYLELSNPQT